MPVQNMQKADVFQISRQGISDAQERANNASRNLSRVEPRLDEAPKPERSQERDMARDMVELTRAAREVSVNARVNRTAGNVSAEVVNLGRRIDVKA